jgi:rubrerythrin
MEAENVGEVILQNHSQVLSALKKLSEKDEIAKCLGCFFINIDKLPDRISPCCCNHKSKFDRTLFPGTTLSVDNKSSGKVNSPR